MARDEGIKLTIDRVDGQLRATLLYWRGTGRARKEEAGTKIVKSVEEARLLASRKAAEYGLTAYSVVDNSKG